METIKKEDYTFAADIEKTREYYKTNSLCDCSCCRNYYAQIKNKFPKLSDFLSDFGIDISKPDEITSIETDSEINYMSIDYTVCGSIEKAGQNEIELYDNLPLKIIVTDGFVSPNGQHGEYFTISVEGIELPWFLNEPFPKPITKSPKFKHINLLRKIFKNRTN